jgi:predicted secreted protein
MYTPKKEDPAVTGSITSQARPSSAGIPLMGAGGKETFYLQAAGTGTATVSLEYKRPWEAAVAPEKTISFIVEVK